MRSVVFALASVVGCSPAPSDAVPEAAPKGVPESASNALPGDAHVARSGEHGGVPWLIDDFEEAKRLANGRLLFVDAWAPWCHTCWSMKREVLHDRALAAFADRVVFLEIDTDKPQNAAFVARFPVRVWPTFFLIQPERDEMVAVQGGSMSLAETHAFLERGLKNRDDNPSLKTGYSALQAGDAAAAALAFEQAADQPGARRTEAVFGAVRAYKQAGDDGRCLVLATRGLTMVEGSAAVGDLSGYVVACSEKLPAEEQQRARAPAQSALESLLDKPAAGASVDDRADHMATLADLYQAAGRSADAKVLHERRLRLLEDDAQKATTPAAARVHDYARMNSYLALGRGDEAVKLLEGRLAELRDDYEVEARLGHTLVALGRHADGIAHLNRAVELSYGPRRLRYLSQLAEAQQKNGDAAAARASHQRLIDENDKLPPATKNVALAAKAAEALTSSSATKPAPATPAR
jgi:tetratricopeptide (TPR) repeat protein